MHRSFMLRQNTPHDRYVYRWYLRGNMQCNIFWKQNSSIVATSLSLTRRLHNTNKNETRLFQAGNNISLTNKTPRTFLFSLQNPLFTLQLAVSCSPVQFLQNAYLAGHWRVKSGWKAPKACVPVLAITSAYKSKRFLRRALKITDLKIVFLSSCYKVRDLLSLDWKAFWGTQL